MDPRNKLMMLMCSMQVNLKQNKNWNLIFVNYLIIRRHLLGLLQSGDEGDDES